MAHLATQRPRLVNRTSWYYLIRSEPHKQAQVVRSLKPGESVELLHWVGEWAFVLLIEQGKHTPVYIRRECFE